MLGCKNVAIPQCRDLHLISWGFHPYDISKFHRPLCRDSVIFAFWRPQGRRSYGGEGGEGGEDEAYVFNLILLADQDVSPGQPKRSLRVATAVHYRYYVQLVAIKRGWMRVANLKSRSARLQWCAERLWLHARTILVAMENLFWLARGTVLVGQGSQIEATQNLPDVRFLDIRFLFLSFA